MPQIRCSLKHLLSAWDQSPKGAKLLLLGGMERGEWEDKTKIRRDEEPTKGSDWASVGQRAGGCLLFREVVTKKISILLKLLQKLAKLVNVLLERFWFIFPKYRKGISCYQVKHRGKQLVWSEGLQVV